MIDLFFFFWLEKEERKYKFAHTHKSLEKYLQGKRFCWRELVYCVRKDGFHTVIVSLEIPEKC